MTPVVSSDVQPVAITGIGSVSPYGPLAGVIPASVIEPSTITAWTSDGPRRAFLVPSFRPANVVPGLKTRRLDRLSIWALVASSLAIKDAGIDLGLVERSRVAVVFATAFGCIDLTEAFYLSAAANGWHETDPSTFPETLASAPPSHVSLFHGFRGPNITVSDKNFAAESAMIQAAGLLRQGQADLAIVLAGDALARSIYSWYEEAKLLSPACYSSAPAAQFDRFIPSEGVAALLMELSPRALARPSSRSYARLLSGRWSPGGGERADSVRRLLAGHAPGFTICGGNGAPCAPSSTCALAREILGDESSIVRSQAFPQGFAGTGALFHLIVALSRGPFAGRGLFLSTAGESGFAALQLELP